MRYEIKARTKLEILDGGFQLYRNHFLKFFAISASIAGVAYLLQALAMWSTTGVFTNTPTPAMGPKYAAMLALTVPIAMLAYHVTHVVLACAVADTYLGRSWNPWRRALAVMPSSVASFALVWLGAAFGMLLLIVPGILWTLNWSLAPQTIVVENQSAGASLKRSTFLTRGRRGKIAMLITLVSLVNMVCLLGAGALLPASVNAVPMASGLLQSIVGALLTPLFACVMTLAYFDARVEKEAFDLEVLASDMDKEASSQPMAVSHP